MEDFIIQHGAALNYELRIIKKGISLDPLSIYEFGSCCVSGAEMIVRLLAGVDTKASNIFYNSSVEKKYYFDDRLLLGTLPISCYDSCIFR